MIKYFKESLQLYVPPQPMLNRDFLKFVLAGHKRLMPLKHVKAVEVPKFDELAVDKMFALMKDNPEFMSYFLDHLPKGRTVSRDYFWNILNTVDEAYVTHLIQHANGARYATVTQDS